jgi:hypothetical protein
MITVGGVRGNHHPGIHQELSPNFRVTNTSFDPDLGKFIDATNHTNYYLGDFLGLTLANGNAYAAWTDTNVGNQDIFTEDIPIAAPPPDLNDRFEPNDTPATATDLGQVVRQELPRLAAPTGDQDWFRMQAQTSGDLTVTITSQPYTYQSLELWNASGTIRLALGSNVSGGNGLVTHQLVFAGVSGQTYLVHVSGQQLVSISDSAVRLDPAVEGSYSLQVQSLTADLGTAVHGTVSG